MVHEKHIQGPEDKTHAEALERLVKMYGYDFARMMTKNFKRVTPEDINVICYACCHYDLRKLTDSEQKKAAF